MAIYFLSKSRLVAKASQFRQLPSKWNLKGMMIRRPMTEETNSSKRLPAQQMQNSSLGQSHQNKQKKKGKLNIKFKWSWKVGAGWTILSILDWWLLALGGWFTWQGVFIRWTPIGVCAFAALDWHYHNRQLCEKGLPYTASSFQTKVYCSLPLRLASRFWGWIADCYVPMSLRPFVYGSYSKMFGVNLDEAAVPDYKNYRSLAEFFTRALKEDIRWIDELCALVSPADGRVLHFGLASNSLIEQVKGVTYSIESFLGPANWIETKETDSYENLIKQSKNKDTSLFQCVIYLAPGDYHRFHSPTCWEPYIRRHFAGELLSVSPKIAKWLPGLFCLNERALYIGNWKHGFFSFTAVGATNVGSIQIFFDEKLKTNKWMGIKLGKVNSTGYEEIRLDNNIKLEKGQLLGQFNMGSTIVLVFEAPNDFEFDISVGQKIKVGERLGYSSEEAKYEAKMKKKIEDKLKNESEKVITD